MIQGEISESFEQKETDHCGEILMEEEDGACMTVRVRLRCVPSSKEGYLVAGMKCSVKGYVRLMFGRRKSLDLLLTANLDDELELEARWGDFEFKHEPFSDHDSDENDDDDPGPHYSALELKQLDSKRWIRTFSIHNVPSAVALFQGSSERS